MRWDGSLWVDALVDGSQSSSYVGVELFVEGKQFFVQVVHHLLNVLLVEVDPLPVDADVSETCPLTQPTL